jgi:hypothetical protein
MWCVCCVVVVRRMSRRRRMTQVDLEGDVGLSTSAFPVEVCRASLPPLLQELVYSPGDCCRKMLFHVVVVTVTITCGITFAFIV